MPCVLHVVHLDQIFCFVLTSARLGPYLKNQNNQCMLAPTVTLAKNDGAAHKTN